MQLTLKSLIMKNLKILSMLFFLTVFVSCSSDSADDDDPTPPVNTDVTYSKNVKPIIDGACIRCHNNPPVNSAPMSLTSYDNVKDAVTSSNLIARVEDGSMPPTGSDLTSTQIKVIKDWETGGFKE